MPYKGMELPTVYPSSSFPDRLLLTDERKTGLQSTETMLHCYASKVDSGAASFHELGATPNFSLESPSYFTSGDKLDSMGAHCENGLFSSSLSGLFSRKLRLYPNHSSYDQSAVAAASQYKDDEPFESLEELEAQTIGNLLPDDDDLLSGVTDGVEYSQPHNGDYTEDLDVFSSVGGMELGDDGLTFGQSNPNIYGSNPSRNVVGLDGSELPFREHLSGEHPSRTLFVRNINSCIEDSELHSLFGKFGDIRTLYTACKNRGFVMISYYDIRAAWNAMKSLQNKPLKERNLDIHFSIPKDNPSDEDVNHGSLPVFIQDSSVADVELYKFFGVYGEIKEIHETPLTSHHKFIEFYDVRAAEVALRALNQNDIAGKRIRVESSWPGGPRRFGQPFSSELDQDGSGFPMQPTCPSSTISSDFSGLFSHGGTASSVNNDNICGLHRTTGCSHSGVFENSFNHLMSSSVPNSLPSLIRTGSVGHQSGQLIQSCGPKGEMKFDLHTVPGFHPPHSLSDICDRLGTRNSCSSPNHMSPSSLTAVPSEINETQQFIRMNSNGTALKPNEGVFSPSGNGSCPPSGGHYYMWSNMQQHPQSQGIIWPNSPSLVNGFCAPSPQQMPTVPRAPNDVLTASLPMRKHHVGSAPSVNSSLWERRNAYSSESPDSSVFQPGSVGDMRISGNAPHPLEFVPRNVFPSGRESYMDLTVRSKNVRFGLHPQRCMMFPSRGQLIPLMNDFGSPNERTRNRRNECVTNQVDNKKQFELDIDRILRGDDKRTTLMIKNIPNKYTSKMLLAVIDEQHRGTYDFIYLPIDFKNKCNMGYAFINMINPSLIIPFYQDFNGKRWEKFNSEKVANLAYARIQGKASLIAHFQNSSLMNEDKRCRPILFNTDGPNAGDQVPFPVGVSVRPRLGKSRARTGDDNREESPQILLKEEVLSSGSTDDSLRSR